MTLRNARLSDIERKYPGSYNDAFEVMVTHLFMHKLNLAEPPIRRKNQSGIESDPVDVHLDIDKECTTGRYAYQAKYYQQGTEISDRKEEFLESINKAGRRGVTNLFFFINKELHENSQTGDKPKAEKDIEKAAKRAGIKLHWYTRDKIEEELDLPCNRYIKELFLVLGGDNSCDLSGFYEQICEKMTRKNKGAAFGSMSLLDSYIEPAICKRNLKETPSCTYRDSIVSNGSDNVKSQSVRAYLESWVKTDEYITIICGEPGHGKTSLCQKAMYDFYKTEWLHDKVLNVFAFSVNPAGTPVQDTHRLDNLNSLLSWGDTNARMDDVHKVKTADCANALVFLDGFDELLEWIPGIGIAKFLEIVAEFLDYYDNYDGFTKPHVVITTRKMVIPPHKEEYLLDFEGRETKIPIYELQLIPEDNQYKWIEKHVGTNFEDSDCYLSKYKKMYKSLALQDELRSILGIPIIFRMIATHGIIPKSGNSLSEIYEKLFDATWKRNKFRVKLEHDKEYMKKKLMRHALRIFADNNDSAEVSVKIGEEEASWLYQFYTKYDKKDEIDGKGEYNSRVGFLHKTLYEHFLACEILFWFRIFGESEKLKLSGEEYIKFEDMLSILGKRKLSKEILSSIKELYKIGQRKGGEYLIEDVAFENAYNILKRTDGILQLPGLNGGDNTSTNSEIKRFLQNIAELMQADEHVNESRTTGEDSSVRVDSRFKFDTYSVKDQNVTPLVRGENVFFNVVSICSACGHPASPEKINVRAMRQYDLRGINLEKADFGHSDLTNSRLAEAVLDGTSFKEAVFERADLSGTVLVGDFIGVDFNRASFEGANLSNALFHNTDMEGALFSNAIFISKEAQAFLESVSMKGARISHAIISDKQLRLIDNECMVGKTYKVINGIMPLEPVQKKEARISEFTIEEDVKAKTSGSMKRYRIPSFGRYMQGGGRGGGATFLESISERRRQNSYYNREAY